MTVADRIRSRRESLGITQEELAKKMGLKGRSSVARIESMGDDVSLKNVEKIAPLLNCSPLYLMGWAPESPVGDLDPEDKALLKVVKPLNGQNKQHLIEYAKFLSKLGKEE